MTIRLIEFHEAVAALFKKAEFQERVKRRLPPSYWEAVSSVLRAAADVVRTPIEKPDPWAKPK